MWRHTYILSPYKRENFKDMPRACSADAPPPEGGPGRGLRSVRGAALVMCKKYTANIKIINYVG